VIVVDQMRGDYVDRFQSELTGGLKRLVTNGAWFTHVAYPYLSTFTCVGHATISTGALPHRHGIIQNAWWDREAGKTLTCTEDPAEPDVPYSGTTTAGDSPRRLLVPSFADEMRQQRAARVVSVSLKARAAIMLAGHGGDAVSWLGTTANEGWLTSSAFTKQPVPAVKSFTDANPIAADYGKSWTRLLPENAYQHPDAGEAEAPPRGWTPLFPHVLASASGQPDDEFRNQWEASPFADDYLGRFAAALAESMQLGHHDGTDVLLISFSSPDLVGHAFGPDSQEIEDMYAHLDATLGRLFERLDALVGRNAYVVALSADHGVTPQPEILKASGKDAGRLNRTTMIEAVDHAVERVLGPGSYVRSINDNDVYFAKGMYKRIAASQAALDAVLSVLRNSHGVAGAWTGAQVRNGRTSSNRLLREAALSYYPGRSGDIIIASRPGWMFSATGTTHGSGYADDQHVPILLMGPGVKPGVYSQAATPADVVPTLAALCGITLPKAEGRPLRTAIAVRPVPTAAPASR
jgi:predicted AlkP superfamily pyrophosphatase or phosphodiesterase